MNDYLTVENAIKLAGFGQLTLVLASVAIPKCLNWKDGLAGLQPLLRQMFWTYAVYITMMHTFFGIVSVFATDELLAGSFITTGLCVLMFIWWFARILIQFFYFDKRSLPKTAFNTLAGAGLVMLFTFLTIVYAWAIWENLR